MQIASSPNSENEPAIDLFEATLNGFAWLLENVVITFEFVALLALLALIFAGVPKALIQFIQKVRTASILGLEVNLSPENNADFDFAFSDALNKLKSDANDYIESIDKSKGSIEAIVELFRKELNSIDPQIQINGRAALHVRDPLFSNALVQSTPYYFFDEDVVGSREVCGRRKSVRYGIIGQAWRSRRSQSMADVDHTKSKLVDEWGALQEEASSLDGTKRWAVAFAFLPKGATDPEAILFFDCVNGAVFTIDGGDSPPKLMDNSLKEIFDQSNHFKKLKQFINSYYHEVKRISVNISIYE